jgi:hypothetical protein
VKKFVFISVLLVLVIFLARIPLVNSIQLYALNAATGSASISNESLSAGSAHRGHRIYSLKGRQRFFANRVNSIQRLKYLYKDFSGFECDIRVSRPKNLLYLGHNSQTAAHKLEDLLASDTEKKVLWFDCKNVRTDNLEVFLEQLTRLDSLYQLKNRIIIESANLDMLEIFSARGYFTSYYLNQDNINAFRSDQGKYCSDGKIDIFSMDISYHDMTRNLCPGKKHLVWDLRFSHSLQEKRIRNYASDSSILVCLMNIKSPGYR